MAHRHGASSGVTASEVPNPREFVTRARQALDQARVMLSRIDTLYQEQEQEQEKKTNVLKAKLEAMRRWAKVHSLLACSVEDENKQQHVIIVDSDKKA